MASGSHHVRLDAARRGTRAQRTAIAVVIALVVAMFSVVVPAVTGLAPQAGAATTNFTLTKTPSTTTLPYGGGSVTYTYTVKNNTSGYLYYVDGQDDKCRNLSRPSSSGMKSVGIGWFKSAWRLDAGATATFTCTQTLTKTTTNKATFTFGTDVNFWAQITGQASNTATATVTMANDVSNVCTIGTIWGNVGVWGGTATAYQYPVNANGTLGAPIKTLTMSGANGADIAISPDGTKMYAMEGTGKIRVYDVATGTLVQTINVSFSDNATWVNGNTANYNTLNSLSFGPNNTLYLGGNHYDGSAGFSGGSSSLYVLDLKTVGTGLTASGTAQVLVPGNSTNPWGFAGDFVTLPNGDLLATVNTQDATSKPSKFILYVKKADGTFAAPIDVGQPKVGSTGIVSWGMTFANGSLWLADNQGNWDRVDRIPTATDTASTVYAATAVNPDSVTAYWGATGSQEVNAQCSSPAINLTKTAGTVTGPDASGVYTATYTVKAINTSTTMAGTYAPITDTQQFDSNLVVQSASWTGKATGSATGAGPYAITTNTTNIAANTTDTYTVSIKFTWSGDVDPSVCSATGGGTFNTVALPAETQPTTDNAACDPMPWVNVAKTAGTNTGPDANGVYSVTYTVDVVNSGSVATTFGALTDTVAFDPNFTVTGLKWTSDKITLDANGNPVTTTGGGPTSGTLTGAGPSFQLAPAGTAIAAGVDYRSTSP